MQERDRLERHNPDISVEDNGRRRQDTDLTAAMVSCLLSKQKAPLPRRVFFENKYALPLGAGFGISGGVALAGALALNEAAQLGLARRDCVMAAHMAELSGLTGLGDVAGQSVGGFEIRVREGPPPWGRVVTPAFRTRPVVVASFGPRLTHDFLKSGRANRQAQDAGMRCLNALRRRPTLVESTRLGRRFAEELHLVSARARKVMDGLGPAVPASIAMLGDTVFALGGAAAASKTRALAGGAFVTATRVARRPARLL